MFAIKCNWDNRLLWFALYPFCGLLVVEDSPFALLILSSSSLPFASTLNLISPFTVNPMPRKITRSISESYCYRALFCSSPAQRGAPSSLPRSNLQHWMLVFVARRSVAPPRHQCYCPPYRQQLHTTTNQRPDTRAPSIDLFPHPHPTLTNTRTSA